MTIDLGTSDSVRQLRQAGLRPNERLVRNIFQAGQAAYAPLLALATDTNLLHEQAPACYAPLHALRLLGEMPTVAMIDPLFAKLPLELHYEEEQLPRAWGEEMPQMVARLGTQGIAPLWALVDDAERALAQRSAALITLAYTTAVAPETRDEIAHTLRERLQTTGDSTITAYLIVAIGDVGMPDLYADVMKLYREGRVNQNLVPASAARQLMLGKSEQRIACARHPLWERYDKHGPFEPSSAQ